MKTIKPVSLSELIPVLTLMVILLLTSTVTSCSMINKQQDTINRLEQRYEALQGECSREDMTEYERVLTNNITRLRGDMELLEGTIKGVKQEVLKTNETVDNMIFNIRH